MAKEQTKRNPSVAILGESPKRKHSSVFNISDKQKENYKSLLAATMIDPSKPEPEPDTLLSYNGTPILWRGGKAFVCGVAKTRKTTTLTIVSAMLLSCFASERGFKSAENLRVLYADTEQSRADSQRILFNTAKLAGVSASNLAFDVLNLNKLDPEQIKGVIEMMLQQGEENGKRYDVLILDNWTDCVNSVLDDKECTEFSRQLRELAEVYNIATLSVIHANESSRNDDRPNFRGWGSEEARKSDLTMFLKDMGDYSNVTFGRCRGRRPEGFSVSHDDFGLPCLYTPTAAETANPDKYADIVAKIPKEGLSYKELCNLIVSVRGNSMPTAKRWVGERLGGAVVERNKVYYSVLSATKTTQEDMPF